MFVVLLLSSICITTIYLYTRYYVNADNDTGDHRWSGAACSMWCWWWSWAVSPPAPSWSPRYWAAVTRTSGGTSWTINTTKLLQITTKQRWRGPFLARILSYSFLQILLLTSQTELGKVIGEILSKATGTSYWDNPFQVELKTFNQ